MTETRRRGRSARRTPVPDPYPMMIISHGPDACQWAGWPSESLRLRRRPGAGDDSVEAPTAESD